MNILLVHQNFPGQFKHLTPALAADPANRVVAFSMRKYAPPPRVQVVSYQPGRGNTPGVHPWVADVESKVIRGGVAFKAGKKIRDEFAFEPDVIIAHHGWGESLFLKEVWPRARMLIYAEWYYPLHGADVGFDPEFAKNDAETLCKLRMKNTHNLLCMQDADAGLSPTHWQRSTHPDWFQPKIRVIHDGLDTHRLCANPAVQTLNLPIPADAECKIEAGEVTLNRGDEIISFVNRNLEPYRGYHIFMRALPELLRRRPKAKVVIVGGNKVSYGASPMKGSWKQIFLDEVRADIDLSRVFFVGNIPYPNFLALLQLTTVHTYLTYPFVLSWSLLEAMACEGAIVASDTEPVREVITEGETGRLVDFFSSTVLVDRICELLDDPAQRARLGRNARERVVQRYDLASVCLPAQKALVEELAQL